MGIGYCGVITLLWAVILWQRIYLRFFLFFIKLVNYVKCSFLIKFI